MTYRAIVKDGQLSIDEPLGLAEGSTVEVRVDPVSPQPTGSPAALQSLRLKWAGEPDEFELLAEQIRREKWDDLVRFKARYAGLDQ